VTHLGVDSGDDTSRTDAVLAATEAQPGYAAGQRLDIEVRRLGLSEVVFE
jgi:hypothetical protein